MLQFTVNGIVTRYADYRESDRILTILTKQLGLVSAKARGCRRPKSALLQAGELFVYGEFVLFKNGDKYTVDSCDVEERFYPLREDISRFGAGAYMLGIVNECATEGEGAEALLTLLLYALSYTAYTECDPADMAVAFAARALALMGYMPALTRCASCGADVRGQGRIRFSGETGGALCGTCEATMPGGTVVSALSLEALRRILALRDEEMKKIVLPPRVRAELKDAVNAYAEHILERRLKAFDCL
ncbi:MAG TPA: DNA repair protein RecO [Clostridia bacterium]|nr:DNA repair protein RecO [Clostridia bacterium]